MIDHVSIGVRNLGAARRFYDAALKPLGCTCLSESSGALGYGEASPRFWVIATERPVPADEKSGLHFCFTAKDRAAVDAFHSAALRAGGRDNGKPGVRREYDENYYAAFVVDPDGYRVEAYCGKAP